MDMNTEGKTRPDCPLGLGVCFPSCHWWRQGFICSYAIEQQCRRELEDIKAMDGASRYPQRKRP